MTLDRPFIYAVTDNANRAAGIYRRSHGYRKVMYGKRLTESDGGRDFDSASDTDKKR